MSKLFKLKKWLSIEGTANHLSKIFNEQLSIADIYQLAIDGHLVISVRMINPCYAKRGQVVGYDKIRTVPPLSGGDHDICLSTMLDEDMPYADARFFNINNTAEHIDGVWDLYLGAGGAQLYLNSALQRSNIGPEITSTNLDGLYVTNDDDEFAVLYERRGGIEYPSSWICDDAELVVKVESIQDLIALTLESSNREPSESVRHSGARTLAAHKRLVAALLEYIDGSNGLPNPQYESDAQLIKAIASHYQGYDGLSVRTLESRFPECRNSLQ